jgi:hypothetical protein
MVTQAVFECTTVGKEATPDNTTIIQIIDNSEPQHPPRNLEEKHHMTIWSCFSGESLWSVWCCTSTKQANTDDSSNATNKINLRVNDDDDHTVMAM